MPSRSLFRLVFLVISLTAAVWARTSEAGPSVERPKRIALVIGNETYIEPWSVTNPANDAISMASVLKDLGFQVQLRTNADMKTMKEAIDILVRHIGLEDTVLFYYSGHGVQVGGENFLLPVDFTANGEGELSEHAISLSRLLQEIENTDASVRIVVLDACRDNPFTDAKSLHQNGLAAVTVGRGTLVAFATAPGKVAINVHGGKNGLFTKYLLEALHKTGLSAEEIFNNVRERVQSATHDFQWPTTTSSLVGRLELRPTGFRDLRHYGTISPTGYLPPPGDPGAPQLGDVRLNAKDGLSYVWIPAGSFQFKGTCETWKTRAGCQPAGLTAFDKGFWLGGDRVTQESYQRVLGKNRSRVRDQNLPVTNVNWREARGYCRSIGLKLPTATQIAYAESLSHRPPNDAASKGVADSAALAAADPGSALKIQGIENREWTIDHGRHCFSFKETVAATYDHSENVPGSKFPKSVKGVPAHEESRVSCIDEAFVTQADLAEGLHAYDYDAHQSWLAMDLADFEVKFGKSSEYDRIGFRCAGDLK